MKITPHSRKVLPIGLFSLVVMALICLLRADNAVADNASPVAKAPIQEAYGKLPLYFEANRGQTDSRVEARITWQEATDAWRRLLEAARVASNPTGTPAGDRDTADSTASGDAGEPPNPHSNTSPIPEKEIQS